MATAAATGSLPVLTVVMLGGDYTPEMLPETPIVAWPSGPPTLPSKRCPMA